MSAVLADFSISCRWVLPMTARDALLENHTLVIRDGRILDLLPSELAAERYAPAASIARTEHLLLPGLIDAYARITPVPIAGQRQSADAALLRIGEMLRSGTTCFCGMGFFPEATARAAAQQGLRALVGIPIAECATPWADGISEHLTRALNFRDDYRGHPTIATAFAPQHPTAMSDAAFARISTLADELDAGIVMALHATSDEIEESVARHGLRPIERLHALGLLTPALTAAHMAHLTPSDIAVAERAGIAVVLCAAADYRSGDGPAPAVRWAQSELRIGLGTGIDDSGACADLWGELKWWSRHGTGRSAWDALAAATRGGAAALGLEADIGTLEPGKWADLCCVDLRDPAMWRVWPVAAGPATPQHPVVQLAMNGTRDLVSDVWVAGRHLLNGGAFTRLDWPALSITGEKT